MHSNPSPPSPASVARPSRNLPQRARAAFCRSGRLFLGCVHGRRKKRTFSSCSRYGAFSVYATQARGICSVTTCLRSYSSRNLDVARPIYNYKLTRARRMLECVFGIVCNKWRIFHCAIGVCPVFCDVIVKNMLHTIQLLSSERRLSFSGYIICTSPREY